MSRKSDILDKSSSSSRNGLLYTCKCGWVDLGHARKDSAEKLWNNIKNENGLQSKDKNGFKITYQQTNSKFGVTDGVWNNYYVKSRLNLAEKESVALSVFMEVSYDFETLQSNSIYKLFTDSGFSSEDLVSDLIGFYRAVRPNVDYLRICGPVSQKAAIKVWEEYGAVGATKNRFFGPFLYPCEECKNGLRGPISASLPWELTAIQSAVKGVLFRDWKDSDNEIHEMEYDGIPF